VTVTQDLERLFAQWVLSGARRDHSDTAHERVSLVAAASLRVMVVAPPLMIGHGPDIFASLPQTGTSRSVEILS